MTATLDVNDLRKQFSVGRPAIDGVSFAVPAGEIVVLLGPSGCGKTTTLRCVAGLEHPTGGEISIAGKVVSSPERGILVPPRLRDLGMVFQSSIQEAWSFLYCSKSGTHTLTTLGS